MIKDKSQNDLLKRNVNINDSNNNDKESNIDNNSSVKDDSKIKIDDSEINKNSLF